MFVNHKAGNIFGFNAGIYGKQIRVRFIDRIRDEVKFTGLEALKAQLNQDKEQAKAMLEA